MERRTAGRAQDGRRRRGAAGRALAAAVVLAAHGALLGALLLHRFEAPVAERVIEVVLTPPPTTLAPAPRTPATREIQPPIRPGQRRAPPPRRRLTDEEEQAALRAAAEPAPPKPAAFSPPATPPPGSRAGPPPPRPGPPRVGPPALPGDAQLAARAFAGRLACDGDPLLLTAAQREACAARLAGPAPRGPAYAVVSDPAKRAGFDAVAAAGAGKLRAWDGIAAQALPRDKTSFHEARAQDLLDDGTLAGGACKPSPSRPELPPTCR